MSTPTRTSRVTQSHFVVHGAEIDALVAGNGDELVVFLHAVGGDKTSFLPQLEALPPRYTGIAADFRGHGSAAKPALETVTLDQFARDVVALVDGLGFDAAHFVGFSMGGIVAQLIHKMDAGRVSSMTLASTWSSYGTTEAKSRIAYLEERLATKTMLEGSRGDMAYLMAPGTDPRTIEAAAHTEASKDPALFAASWRSLFTTDVSDVAARVTCPTLLVGGPHDPVAPRAYLDALADLLPGAQIAMIDGAGHFANLEKPDAFNQALFGFLRGAGVTNTRRAGTSTRIEAPADTTAQALIHLLSARGVELLFSNSGTDFVDVIDALARYDGTEGFRLKPVLAPHESTIVAMAHGAFLAGGRPQAAMAHVNVGTSNMVMGTINASRARVPMLLLAGRTPYLEGTAAGSRRNFVQWGQDTFDQASFREFLKWDYELKTHAHLETAVDRALAIAESDPQGPVYMAMPGEVLAERTPGGTFAHETLPRQRRATLGAALPSAIARAAELIRRAQRPLIVTAEGGRYRRAVPALARFAERFGVGVVEFGKHNFMNLPTSSPMHLGFDPHRALRDCDLLIAVECHVPYIPAFVRDLPRPPTCIQVGIDPLAGRIPMRGFPADIALLGDPASTLNALGEAIGAPDDRMLERQRTVAAQHQQVFAEARAAAEADARGGKLTKAWLSLVVGDVIAPEDLIFNEYDLDPTLVPRTVSGTWFENSIASGLGWALGAAVGAKLVAPERTVIATVGDGSYLFNVPLSAHAAAADHDAGILIVVFNDAGYSTIRRTVKQASPDGHATRLGKFPLCDAGTHVDFVQVARAVGHEGVLLDRPETLHAGLREALSKVRDGRTVLCDVRCERDD